ncbi:MAG TPA: primase-helicase zinc-binding domain-containing protein [Herpetosiphonaceae bacterium]|nr:primase-helicase zinc-binding domain-containing protein [Herpetosiphonaceae bacterium]
MFAPAEIDQVKASTDILALAERYSTLRKVAAREYAGPCPKCGGRDRFHVDEKRQTWMCRSCTGAETWGDVIALQRFLTGEDFPAAVKALGGTLSGPAEPVQPRKPEARQLPQQWKKPEWQQKAHALTERAARCLDRDAGAPGRTYLSARGIDPYTAYCSLLGFSAVSPPWNEEQQRQAGGPSITMPYIRHVDDAIMAVRYRRINTDEDRYINMAGSTVRLFGLHLLNWNASTLVVIEGELNAISVWQAAKGMDLAVVSIGGHSLPEQVLGDVGRLSARFQHCIVWCDEPDKAQKLRAAVTSPTVQARRSPTPNGKKIDANDMLQRGLLGELLRRMVAA